MCRWISRWILAAGAASFAAVVLAAGSASVAPEPTNPEGAEARAWSAYGQGLQDKERAWAMEAKAEATEDPVLREAFLKHAIEAYLAAAEHQRSALAANPQLAEAANELGYALRKTGDYKAALRTYSYALILRPDFAQAKEYQAEALLALSEFDATRSIYKDLAESAPLHAELLMQAMNAWADALKEDADAQARSFADWVRSAGEPETQQNAW